MIRKAFVMSIHPDQHEEYQRRHNPIWPELEAALKDHGISNYSLFLNPESHQLFGYAEIQSEEAWNAIATTTICQQWWASMKELMPSNSDNSPVSVPLTEVFHIE